MSEVQRTVAFAEEGFNDLVLINEYLTQAYCGFGESLAEANRHAQLLIEAIIAAAYLLAVVFVIWLWIVPSIGFVHALSNVTSRCFPCSLAGKTTSAECWCGCCKTAPRLEPALSTL